MFEGGVNQGDLAVKQNGYQRNGAVLGLVDAIYLAKVTIDFINNYFKAASENSVGLDQINTRMI